MENSTPWSRSRGNAQTISNGIVASALLGTAAQTVSQPKSCHLKPVPDLIAVALLPTSYLRPLPLYCLCSTPHAVRAPCAWPPPIEPSSQRAAAREVRRIEQPNTGSRIKSNDQRPEIRRRVDPQGPGGWIILNPTLAAMSTNRNPHREINYFHTHRRVCLIDRSRAKAKAFRSRLDLVGLQNNSRRLAGARRDTCHPRGRARRCPLERLIKRMRTVPDSGTRTFRGAGSHLRGQQLHYEGHYPQDDRNVGQVEVGQGICGCRTEMQEVEA